MLRLWVLVFLLLLFWAEQLQLTQVQHLLVLIHLGGCFCVGIFICLVLLVQLLMGLLVVLFLFLN